MRTLIISGLSGAGKSSAVKTLEDLGFYCIDNLPVSLLHPFLDLSAHSTEGIQKLAVVIDARDKKNIGQLPRVMKTLREEGRPVETLFLDASDEALTRRFSETRHRHPLSPEGSATEGIRRERELLAPIRKASDRTLDTSGFSSKDLRKHLTEMFGAAPEAPSLSIQVSSFGFKFGLPVNADLVFDVRFLPNPFFRDDLKLRPGTDPKVVEFVMGQEDTAAFLTEIDRFLRFLIPRFDREGKSYLHIAVGCTGGKHRSVVLAEEMAKVVGAIGYTAAVEHRDLGRE